MRTATLVLALVFSAATLTAQDTTITIRFGPRAQSEQRLTVRQLPRDVAEEAVRFFNAPATVHFSGATRIPLARGVDGDVAILGGPVTVAGRISGSLLVVNGDVTFERGATVVGDVTVIGGTINGADDADIRGEIRSYRDPLRYRRYGDEIVYAPQRELPRYAQRVAFDARERSRSDFLVAMGGTYNRVEGAPIHFGPRIDERLNDGMRLRASLIGIVRSGRDFALRTGDFGYRVNGELMFGSTRGGNLGLGARAIDLVQSTEPWPLKDYESGWAAFLLHKDYRDYYRREGFAVYAALRPSNDFTLQAEGREEQHHQIDVRDPWTLFRSDQVWRANPAISGGEYRSLVGSLRLDTRNDRAAPTSGLFVTAEYELGQGRNVDHPYGQVTCVAAPCNAPGLEDGKLDYQRVFFDARTYLRVTPAGRLNLRVAGGGWVGGDPLPLQRRMALGAPDPLPGYGFRDQTCGGSAPVLQGLCERVLVAQAEFRTHLGFEFGPDWANDWGGSSDEIDYEPFHVSGPDIVVFADAGRGWLVGNASDQVEADKLPALADFKSDLGLGLDFGPIGFYLARALDGGDRPVTFTVRMGRRF